MDTKQAIDLEAVKARYALAERDSEPDAAHAWRSLDDVPALIAEVDRLRTLLHGADMFAQTSRGYMGTSTQVEAWQALGREGD